MFQIKREISNSRKYEHLEGSGSRWRMIWGMRILMQKWLNIGREGSEKLLQLGNDSPILSCCVTTAMREWLNWTRCLKKSIRVLQKKIAWTAANWQALVLRGRARERRPGWQVRRPEIAVTKLHCASFHNSETVNERENWGNQISAINQWWNEHKNSPYKKVFL